MPVVVTSLMRPTRNKKSPAKAGLFLYEAIIASFPLFIEPKANLYLLELTRFLGATGATSLENPLAETVIHPALDGVNIGAENEAVKIGLRAKIVILIFGLR